jgi:hypothetical protein
MAKSFPKIISSKFSDFLIRNKLKLSIDGVSSRPLS